MKKLMITFSLALLSISLFSNGYENKISSYISELEAGELSAESYKKIALKFDQLATQKEDQWLPNYYAAFCNTLSAFSTSDGIEIDKLLDLAEVQLKKAKMLKGDLSEIYCIESMIHSARIAVNPYERANDFGPIAIEMIEKAKYENPNNPRSYYIQAQGLLYTPEQYGGGCKNAQLLLYKAEEKFKTQNPKSEIHPAWGLKETQELIKQCN